MTALEDISIRSAQYQAFGGYRGQRHSAEDVPLLLDAVEAVTALHKPRTEQVITGDCADGACEHEEADDCPKTPFEVCSECWRVAEEAAAYFSEGGVSIVAYPCPAVKAITAALGGAA